MKEIIYADNAATERLSPDALEAMTPWLTSEYGNASQPYFSGLRARASVESARETVSGLIGASPDEIFFTSGGTESDNWAIRRFFRPDGEARIIISSVEHHAVSDACLEAAIERRGKTATETVPVGKDGVVDADVLSASIGRGGAIPTLVSVMLANNEIGTVEPVGKLAERAHARGAYFHTDAVAAAGKIPINAGELGVDMLSASAHKFGGPQGMGFLYIKKGTPLSPFFFGGAQERSMRAGTENVAGIVGTAAALKSRVDGMKKANGVLVKLEERLLSRLCGADFIRNGAKERIPGLLSLSFRGADGETILHRLDLKGIAVSTGAACDSVRTELSHVIRAIGVPEEYAKGTVRISLGVDNTEREVDRIAAEIIEIIKDR